ncbi:sulfotransferase domain-containing protein [Oceaniserpentilla sp. 4NH20-0058]|uniref:hypothetical protein n=1 Tax=Oceaniserpentilla sp. 4NH20-0058 TaxID=3127660 RepID=UPI00310B8A7B
MSKRLILHIGAEKTATTFIQNYMSVNRENYKEQGVLYPKTSFGEHAQFSLIAALHDIDHGFGLEFAPKGKAFSIESEWMPLINRLNKQSKFHTVLISAEHFSSRLKDKGLETLSEILGQLEGYEIEVIYYFRRQDDFFQSWYSTHIKAGGYKTLKQALIDDFKNHWFFDIYYLIEKWKNVLPNAKFHIRPYDYVSKNIGMIKDFTTVLDLPVLDNALTPNLDRNESWSPYMLAIARHINEFFQPETLEKRYQILEFIASNFQRDEKIKNLLSVDIKKKILNEFDESNRKLCLEYNINYDLIFSDPVESKFVNPDGIEVNDLKLTKVLIEAIKASL